MAPVTSVNRARIIAVMKLCISTLACPSWSLDQIIDGCVQFGIQGIDFRGIGAELDVTRLPEFNERFDKTLARLRAHRLVMPCLNTSIQLITPDARAWNAFLEECHRYAQIAGKCGTMYLRVFGGSLPDGMTRDAARVLGERHLRQLSKICRPHGCKPLLETHDAWRTADEVLELIHAFVPEDAGVVWDIEHTCNAGEPPDQTVQRLRRYIDHVHIKDAVITGGSRVNMLLGEGNLPIHECVRGLRDNGYDGWYCLETEKRWQKDAPDPEQSIPQFAQFMRSL